MPILEITDTHVTQRCASCEARRELPIEALVPAEDSQPLENGVLTLPACTCGATEFLIRAPQNEPPHPAPGSLGHLHRMVVDALVDEVKERLKDGRMPRSLEVVTKARFGAEAVQRWFPRGLKVEVLENMDEDSQLQDKEEGT